MKQRYIRCIALLYSCIFALTWRQSLISGYSDTVRYSAIQRYSDTAIQCDTAIHMYHHPSGCKLNPSIDSSARHDKSGYLHGPMALLLDVGVGVLCKYTHRPYPSRPHILDHILPFSYFVNALAQAAGMFSVVCLSRGAMTHRGQASWHVLSSAMQRGKDVKARTVR